MTKKYRNLVYF